MLQAFTNSSVYSIPQPKYNNINNERMIVADFTVRVNAMGALSDPSPALQARLLGAVKTMARRLDMIREKGSAEAFVRRVLYEDARWSLAAIILRPGQEISAHDHGGWGCAVTVQGIERDRRLVLDVNGAYQLISERDYAPGMGYSFDPKDVHQPVGADPRRVTVALHFLVLEGQTHAHADADSAQKPAFRSWLRVM